MQVDLELYREDVIVSEKPRIRLSVIDIGPERPEGVIVFVHGYGGHALQWVNQIKAFSDRFRVLAPDLRGHNRSDAPHTRYTIDEIVGDLWVMLKKLGVQEPVTLVGHSFGGAVVTEFALRYPERVGRLVLIAATGEYRLAPLLSQVFRLPLAVLRPIQSLARRSLWAPAHVLKPLYQNTLRRWNGWSMFRDLRLPVMVIRGDRDTVYPARDFAEVARVIPNAEDINVGASGHLVQLERADAVNRALERFLSEKGRTWRDTVGQAIAHERPWVRHYEPGVPVTLGFPKKPLHRLLDSAIGRYGRRPATIFGGRVLSYRQLGAEVNRMANALRSLGVEKGVRVMLLLPNCPQFIIAYYAVLRAGGIVVSTSPVNDREELLRQVDDSGAAWLITLTRFQEMARAALERPAMRGVIYTNIKDYLGPIRKALFTLRKEQAEGHRLARPLLPGEQVWGGLMAAHPPTEPGVDVSPDDIAVIQYTGGTTSKPKGVMLSHRALVANTLQVRHWVTNLEEGREKMLCVLPFSHIYGMTTAMNVAIVLGAAMIILPTFVTLEVLKAIRRYRPTLFPGVPTMYTAINQFRGVRRYGISSIKACISGAAPLPVEVQEAFEKLTRGRLVEGYGLTEAGPVTHANPLHGLRKVGTIGVPLPNTLARVVDLATGKDCAAGCIGELLVKGPQLMDGYWGMGEETDKTLTPDGWLRTGDIARMDDDGYFQIISRRQDMILAGRYQVYPRDVEEVLYEHPGVQEVAVVGLSLPSEDGQRVKAYVVPRSGTSLSKDELIALCKRRLEEYAVPWEIEFRDELPKSFVGKVLRRLLVEEETHKAH